jgi:hypothetical protein
MARSLLVAPAAEDVGPASTCLGLLRALDRSGVHVAYCQAGGPASGRRHPRPVTRAGGGGYHAAAAGGRPRLGRVFSWLFTAVR